MDTTIDQQVEMDEALVPHACRLRIGRSNFSLLSDISSKESTLQLVYDVVRLTPFFKAFLVPADVSKIYIGAIRRLTDVNINKLHQPWRSFSAIINKCLTGKSSGYDILRNSDAYKEYYAVAIGATPPKTKASVRKTRSSFDTTVTPPPTAAAGPRLSTSAKGKQPATTSKAKNEGTGTIPGVLDVPTNESEEEISWKSTDEEGDDDDDDDDDDEGD
nr:hypothetical protein [Tanacetum cinerariifolium]